MLFVVALTLNVLFRFYESYGKGFGAKSSVEQPLEQRFKIKSESMMASNVLIRAYENNLLR
jgi:hypothetical protein